MGPTSGLGIIWIIGPKCTFSSPVPKVSSRSGSQFAEPYLRQSLFPGVKNGSPILEEDVGDLLEPEADGSHPLNSQPPSSEPDVPHSSPLKKSEPDVPHSPPPKKSKSEPDVPHSPPPKKFKSNPPANSSEPPSFQPDNSQSTVSQPGKSLATSEKHTKVWQEADARYRLNAERMQLKYSKGKHKKVSYNTQKNYHQSQDLVLHVLQVVTFNEGDFVSIRVPRIDRTSTDSHRLPCVIVERLGNTCHLYRLK